MRRLLVAIAAVGVAAFFVSGANAQGKATKRSVQPACLNALACGPQPAPKVRKPKSEKFMRSAS